jgi:hypothetical protein
VCVGVCMYMYVYVCVCVCVYVRLNKVNVAPSDFLTSK